MFKVCVYQLKCSITSARFYMALLIGTAMQIISCMPLLAYAKATGQPLCLFEAFLYFNCDSFAAAAAFLGIVLLVSDIPFSTQNEIYTLMRISRKKWIFGKVLYLLCICALYYWIIFLFGAIYICENAYFANIWSQPLYLLVKDTTFTFTTDYKVCFPYAHIVLYLTPLKAAVGSFCLSVAYGFVMSLLLFWLNVKLPRAFGYFLTILAHVTGYVLAEVLPTMSYVRYSLFGNSLMMYHDIGGYFGDGRFLSIAQSVFVFGLDGFILLFLLIRAIRKYDFRITVGGK